MSRRRLGLLRNPRTFLTVLLLLLASQSSQTQVGNPPGLNFFKNFFVTGNYVAASEDFGSESGGGGFLEAEINFDQPEEMVPPNADVVGAFLYWQTIVDANPLPVSGVEFRGEDISEIAKQVAFVRIDPNTSPCWSGGGQGTYKMLTFRADVLRLLPVPLDEDGNPIGKRLVNFDDLDDPYPNAPSGFGPHTVRLPDNGTGNQTPQTAGASLIIIYRLPTESLTSIVLYDGLQLKPKDVLPTTTQALRGFYQAAANPLAKLTLLVGSGAKNATEQVRFGPGLGTDLIIATNPFFTRESNSPGSDRAWDGPTWDVSTAMPNPPVTTDYGEEVTVQVTHTDANPYDCLATSAVVFSTEVDDTDVDGLLNVWETGDVSDLVPTHAPLLDPTGEPLPNLYAMGANPEVQDIFVEIGFMSSGAYDDPLPGSVPAHTHLPSQAVVDNVAAVFASAAPRKNPANMSQTISGPIKVHFDVGNRYQTSLNVINAAYARGGEGITETETCPVAQPTCSFPGFRGVVGWKLGYRLLRDQPLSHPDEAGCEAAGPACVRRFDRIRRHMFRYALFAHAAGIPSLADPSIPRSVSGVSDAGNGGGDFMVTLGLWDNNTGTEFMQTSTIVHEFGHTGGLRHGGSAPTPGNPAPNCKPNYQSVMSYLFQVRGLIGLTGPKVDLSRQVLKLVHPGPPSSPLTNLDEASLTETALKQGTTTAASVPALYPTRWYAPKSGSFLDGLVGTTASTRHCDGTPLESGQPCGQHRWRDGASGRHLSNRRHRLERKRDGKSRRVGVRAGPELQWRRPRHEPRGSSSRRSVHRVERLGASRPAADGQPPQPGVPVARDHRRGSQPPRATPGYGDPGYGDPGYGDPGYGDPGYGDPGYGDPGYGDPGYGDPGYGDPGYGDPGYGGEVDVPGAESLGPSANTLSYTTTNQSINLKWLPPHAGGTVASYHVWKVLGPSPPSPTNPPTDVTPQGIAPGTICYPATQSIFCDFAAQNNRTYDYFVVTWFQNGKKTRSETISATR